MGEWRTGTWATLFGGCFLSAATMTVTWIGVSASAARPLPFWPIIVFFLLGVIGLAGFLVAIYFPERLPGRSAAEREEQRRHQSELQLDGRKATQRRARDFLSPSRPDYSQQRHTEAMNRLADELKRQRESEEPPSE